MSEEKNGENIPPSQPQAEQEASDSAQQHKKSPSKGKFAPTSVHFRSKDGVELEQKS